MKEVDEDWWVKGELIIGWWIVKGTGKGGGWTWVQGMVLEGSYGKRYWNHIFQFEGLNLGSVVKGWPLMLPCWWYNKKENQEDEAEERDGKYHCTFSETSKCKLLKADTMKEKRGRDNRYEEEKRRKEIDEKIKSVKGS